MVVEPSSVSGSAAWLSVSLIPAGQCLVVEVAGEADAVTAVQLRDGLAALADGPRSIVLDLTDLEFCSLPGLRALIEAVEVAEQAGATVHMHGMSRQLAWLYGTFLERRRTVGRHPAETRTSRSPTPEVRSISLV